VSDIDIQKLLPREVSRGCSLAASSHSTLCFSAKKATVALRAAHTLTTQIVSGFSRRDTVSIDSLRIGSLPLERAWREYDTGRFKPRNLRAGGKPVSSPPRPQMFQGWNHEKQARVKSAASNPGCLACWHDLQFDVPPVLHVHLIDVDNVGAKRLACLVGVPASNPDATSAVPTKIAIGG